MDEVQRHLLMEISIVEITLRVHLMDKALISGKMAQYTLGILSKV